MIDTLKEFAGFLAAKNYATSTRRVYIAAAKRALRSVREEVAKYQSPEELLSTLRENMARESFPGLRIAPFLGFINSKTPQISKEIPDYGPLRNWVLGRIEDETKSVRKPSIQARRDLAMLAALCVAPEKGSPRGWPKGALAVERQGGIFRVKLWNEEVKAPSLAMALLYWSTWRNRLDRPDQSRIYRKDWAYSNLLFPDSKGDKMKKWAMHDALARLAVKGEEAVVFPTPELVRQAFLQLEKR
jgi:hypothetical protein